MSESLVVDRDTPRDEAVARHGSHWSIVMSDPPAIREVLGTRSYADGSLAAVEATAISVRLHNAKRELARAERILGSAESRLAILLSRLGLHRRSAAILESAGKYRATAERCRAVLAEGEGWKPERILLPATLRVPPVLPVGTTLWEVGFEWPLDHGVLLRELKVSSVDVYDLTGTGDWDYSVYHHTERVTRGPGTPSSSPSFHTTPDGAEIPPPPRTIQSSRLFLTREAAAACMAEVAQLLEERGRQAREASALAMQPVVVSGPP